MDKADEINVYRLMAPRLHRCLSGGVRVEAMLASWPPKELHLLLEEIDEFHRQAMADLEKQYRRAMASACDPAARDCLDESLALSKSNVAFICGHLASIAGYFLRARQ